MKINSIIDTAKQAIEQGFAPIRLSRCTKLPIGKGWQTNAIVRDDKTVFDNGDNLGLACGFGGLVAIDVDRGGEDALDRVIKHLGRPIRRIGRANAPNREKWIYRQALPECPAELIEAARKHQTHARDYIGNAWSKDKQPTYKPYTDLLARFIRDNGLIKTQSFRDPVGLESYEIKSFGAQIVIPPSIHHTHADVEWIEAEELPTPKEWAAATPITAAVIKALRFEATGMEEPAPREHAEHHEPTPYDERLMLSAMDYALNKGDGYEHWRNIGYGAQAPNPESMVIFEKFDEISAEYEGHDTAHTEALWESASPDGGIGPGTVFYHAKQRGWDRAKAVETILREDIDAEADLDKLTKDHLQAIADAKLDPIPNERLLQRIAELTPHGIQVIKRQFKLFQGRSISKDTKSQKEEAAHLDIALKLISRVGEDNLVCCKSGLYMHGNGVWDRVEEGFFKGIIQNLIRETDRMTKAKDKMAEDFKASDVNSIYKLVENHTYIPDHRFDVGPKLSVNCLNGELHWNGQDFELKSHCREHYRTAQIPVQYDRDAVCPNFDRYLNDVFFGCGDASQRQSCILEMMGYSLVPSTREELFIQLYGGPGGGKSTLLRVLKMLVGGKCCANIPVARLDDKFKVAHLHGKLVNLSAETGHDKDAATGRRKIVAAEVIKGLTSGDNVTGEHKFKDPFEFEPFAKLWFAGNHLLSHDDHSGAMTERARIIEFPRKFRNTSGQDKDFVTKLEAEKSGILNRVLDAYGFALLLSHMTDPESSVQLKKRWEIENDLVGSFIEEDCEMDEISVVRVKVLYDWFQAYCRRGGYKGMPAMSTFSRRLEDKGFAKWKSDGVMIFRGLKPRAGNSYNYDYLLN